MKEYTLIPMDEITDQARELAVLWGENMVDDFILQKHKLASDIMNYAKDYHESRLEEYKATPVAVEDKPKVVCFCGSTRFAEWFMIKRWELEKQGIITFGINILPDNYFAEGNAHGAEQEGVKHILDELHKRKIDLSDEVFVLNVGGYIGESTRAEINYAISKNIPVKYLDAITKTNK